MEKANRWMESQRKNFRQLAISDQMIRKRVEALEQAAAQSTPLTLRMTWS